MVVDAMLEGNALEVLVQRLLQLDEGAEVEEKAVFNVLATFENMIEVRQASMPGRVGEGLCATHLSPSMLYEVKHSSRSKCMLTLTSG